MHGFTVIDDSIRTQIIGHPVLKQAVSNRTARPPYIKDGAGCGTLCQYNLHKAAH